MGISPSGLEVVFDKLDKEFMRNLPEMLRPHPEKWTVFGISREGTPEGPLNFWDTFQNAYSGKIKEYGTRPCLIRQVRETYPVYGINIPRVPGRPSIMEVASR